VTVLVGTVTGVMMIRDDARPQLEIDGAVTALAPDANGACWGVLDRRTLIHRELDGSWVTVPAEVDDPITAVHPTGFGALVGTDDARLWAIVRADSSPVTGFDSVAGRDRWHAVGSPRPYVRSVTSTAGDGALLASVHVGGIPRSTNGGASWFPTVDVDADVHEVRAHPVDQNLVMAAAAVGLLESDDGGATWREPATRGLHATYLRALAFPTGAVIVSASDGPFGRRVALYRRDLEGRDFERCTAGLPDWLPVIVDTGLLAARGRRVVAGTADQIALSDDSGQHWTILAGELPPVTAVAVLSAPGG
jgi:hypothetical protein